MEIIRYEFRPINSNMYVIPGKNSAIIIDPCISEEALLMLKERGIKHVLMLLTHEHYDHISGVNWWKEMITSDVLCSVACNERICDPRQNLSAHYDVLFLFQSKEVQEESKGFNFEPFSCYATQTFEGDYHLEWEGHEFDLTETPGHSPGSCCIVFDKTKCFTGDSLILGLKTCTRLPKGNRKVFNEMKENYLKKLPEDCIIYPGHGVPFSIKDVDFDLL